MGLSLFGCKDDQAARDPAAADPNAADPAAVEPTPAADAEPLSFNTWIQLHPDDRVTMQIGNYEMGQGVLTSLAMILAEELDADWSKVRSVHAATDTDFYVGDVTGGSRSVRMGYDKLRKAGAAVRAMLIDAAAARWQVEAKDCRTEPSRVVHPDGKTKLSYGELATEAAERTAPEAPTLKDPKDFRIIGKSIDRVDVPDKVTGKSMFGLDVMRPGLMVAQVERSPVFGGKLASFDGAAAAKVAGVHKVVEVPSGVAVVAEHTDAAQQGRAALSIEWDDGGHGALTSAAISEALKGEVAKGSSVRADGDAAKAMGAAKATLEAVYEVPYLAHAAMEPLNCTVEVGADSCEIWTGTQWPADVQRAAGEILGIAPEKVKVHPMMLGGGFGRRSHNDFVKEAVHIAKAAGKPVKTVWTREDDTQGGQYRPVSYHSLSGAVDDKGKPVAWVHRISSPALDQQFLPRQNGVDPTTIEGASNLPYGIANLAVTCAHPELPVSTWFWRSVGSSHNAYVTECFFDELAALGGRDPVELRLELLADHPRHKRVLERAAENAGWGTALADGRARGVAVHECFGGIVAEIAEVSLSDSGAPKVHRVVCAVDCGVAVNPNTIAAQMESGIVYGLSAALWGRVDIEGGRPVQLNFDRYRVMRINEMPTVETHIIAEGDPVGGIGEPGTPPIAPAVCNALRTLTGKPVRRLPIDTIA